ncbi:DUF4157 domain-containing protein [Streptomyces sp. CB02959]|uniref:eCIS core domain-containing protein n=1 Tax=Streptomyces sp. CB02959 TaxID=2020330 RepID=UPI0027E5506B|nr:DUF4157 domain-containing protein [Streptomyces sp. CB02959]
MIPVPVVRDSVARRVRRELSGGVALEQKVRSWLEGAFGVDMGQVRIHTGAEADGLARAFEAEAFTVGADIFFQDGCFNPGSRVGRWLLAHEVAHAVRQGGGAGAADAECVQPYDDLSEYAADEAATFVVSGRKVPGPAAAPQRLTDAATMLVQCHSSWEHRMLGDCNTNSLDVVARSLNKSQGDSGAFLRKMRQLLELWQRNPESVTEAQMREHFPDIRAIRMQGSGLLVTYGELNTLADYLPQPAVLDAQPKSILLPILQTVRQETYNKIGASWLLNASSANFVNNLVNWNWGGFVEKILETRRMDDLTRYVGTGGVGHYYGLLARNACHFAPYAWHRWYQFHMISRDYAMRSWQAGEGSNGENRYKAWLYHGYADHFLQDSFAAGHLVNKTLIMQWFVDWVADKYIPTGDWNRIKTMTTALQPGLAPNDMYTSWPYTGTTKDPETGQEMATYETRRAASGVSSVSGSDLGTAYSNYLTFLTNSVTQASTAALHDYYNEQSLWVSSPAHTTPFQIWGDDTLLKSGDGVRIASETAKLSQQALLNILDTGTDGDISPGRIRDRFPTKAGTNSSSVIDLQHWHASVHDKAVNELFGSVGQRGKYAAVWAFSRRLGKVSLDDGFTAPHHPVHHWIRRGSDNWYEARSPGWSTSTAPALCEFNSKLYAVFAAADGTLVWNRYSSGDWEWAIPPSLGPASQPYASNFAPTLTVWNNRLYCAYIDMDDRTVRLSTYNGSVWSTPERVPGTGSSIDAMTPALVGSGSSLFLVFRGPEGAGSTYFTEFHSVLGWLPAQPVPDWNTDSPVGACGANGFLHIARRGTQFHINVATRQSGVWVKAQYGEINAWLTEAGPSMAIDGSQLWMAYFSPDSHVHVGRGTASPDGSTTWSHDFRITEDYSEPETPGLALFDGQVHVMFRY